MRVSTRALGKPMIEGWGVATEILRCLSWLECIKCVAHNHSSDANISNWHFPKFQQQFPINDWEIFPYVTIIPFDRFAQARHNSVFDGFPGSQRIIVVTCTNVAFIEMHISAVAIYDVLNRQTGLGSSNNVVEIGVSKCPQSLWRTPQGPQM